MTMPPTIATLATCARRPAPLAVASSSSRVAARRVAPCRAAGGVRRATTARLGGGFDREGGAGVIDRPDFDLGRDSNEPQTDDAGGVGVLDKVNKVTGGGSYRVLLLHSDKHTESLVAKVLPEVVGCDDAHARNCYHTSKTLGMAIVTTAIKEMAEHFAQQLYMRGCRSTIEPDDSTM